MIGLDSLITCRDNLAQVIWRNYLKTSAIPETIRARVTSF